MKKYDYIIGIDPGVNTGYALWDVKLKCFMGVLSTDIHVVMHYVDEISAKWPIFVRVEDARQRKWFGDRSNSKQQGAGSIKRDCKIWEDFLTDLGVDFEMIHPIKNGTKLSAKTFKQTTGWDGGTNEHGRDAAMLVYKFNQPNGINR